MKKLIEFYPEIAKEWHPTKNKLGLLEKITCGSHRKVWWICHKGHEYEARPSARIDCTGRKGYGCPYCGRKKKVGPLSETHPHLISEWHPKNILKPNDITSGSHIKVWWVGACGHEWEAFIHNRGKPHKPSNCPYCCNRSVDESNNLEIRFPEIAKEWHPTKNNVLPSQVNYNTYKKVWWLGKCGHEWYSIIRTRTRKISAGCPQCQESKGEIVVEKTLQFLDIPYKKQVRFASCKSKRPLPFDFLIEDRKILIEYQGVQHYKPVNFGGDYLKKFEELQKRDLIKFQWCKDYGYKLVLIPYWEFSNIQTLIEKEVCCGAQD